ncbi:RNase H family protein [Vreelandella sulfidaeris]
MTMYQNLAERRAKFVTVFCDASHCPNTLATGWAVWMKLGSPPETKRLSGALPGVKDSQNAEIIALEEALAHLETRLDLKDQIVVIESDCLGAIDAIRDRALRLTALGAKYVKLKWVKGHQGVKCARSAVNTWCDSEAKRNMRALRDAIIKRSGECQSEYAPKETA